MGWQIIKWNPFAGDEEAKRPESDEQTPASLTTSGGASPDLTRYGDNYTPLQAFGQTATSPKAVFTPPPPERPRGAAAFADPQQYIEVAKGVPGGAVSFVGTGMQGLGAVPSTAQLNVQKNAQARIDVLDRLDRGEKIPLNPLGKPGAIGDALGSDFGYSALSPEQRARERKRWETGLSTYRPTPLAEQPLYQAGESVKNYAKTILPAAPGYEDAFGRQIGEGLGSLLAGLPFGAAGRIPGAIFFGAGGAGEAGTRAIAYDQAEKRAGRPGLTQDQINAASLYGIGPGTTDLLPVEVLLGRLKVPAALAAPLARFIGRVGGQAFIEGAQEGGQAFLQNAIEQGYNPEQSLTGGVAGEAAVGGAVGATAQVLRDAATLPLAGLTGRRGAGGTAGGAAPASDPFAEPIMQQPDAAGSFSLLTPAAPLDVDFTDLIPPERRITEGPAPQTGVEPSTPQALPRSPGSTSSSGASSPEGLPMSSATAPLAPETSTDVAPVLPDQAVDVFGTTQDAVRGIGTAPATSPMAAPEISQAPTVGTGEILGELGATPARRGVGVIQFIRSMGGLKPSRELMGMDARRYPGLINRNGLDADKMREAMVQAGYLQESGPDQPAITTPADVFDLLEREIRGERVVPAADRESDEAFFAAQKSRDEQRELQAAEQNFIIPEIRKYDAELGGEFLWNAYNSLDADTKAKIIDRNRRGEDIVDLIEEVTTQDPVYYALGAPLRARRERDALGYYSKAVEAANALQRKAGPPAGFLNDLQKAGVTKNEIEATGLDKFLASKGQIATKQEIVDFLAKNQVEVKENVYGGVDVNDLPYDMREEFREKEVESLLDDAYDVWFDEEEGRWTYGLYGEPSYDSGGGQELFDSEEDARAELREMLEGQVRNVSDRELAERHMPPELFAKSNSLSGVAKWSEYSLDPSNPTYRENVISLEVPHPAKEAWLAREKELNAKYWKSHRQHWSVRATPEERAEMDRLDTAAQAEDRRLDASKFRTGHWSEPNVIAHTRTQMLNDTKGRKVFNIDELQSDWGQKIREGGARDEAKIADLRQKIETLRARDGQLSAQVYPYFEKPGYENDPGYVKLTDDMLAVKKQRDLLEAELRTAEAATPSHPLVNTTDQWVTTAMRRLIQQAVDSGADGISITPAKVQNERFRLSRRVGQIAAVKQGAKYWVAMEDLEGQPLFRNQDGWSEHGGKEFAPDELRTLIGRGLADRVMANADAVPAGEYGLPVAGAGLDFGGEGMRATYDKMYPEVLGKLLKKLDPSIKAEKTRLWPSGQGQSGEDQFDHASQLQGSNFDNDFIFFPLTEKAKQKLEDEGQPLFALGAGNGRSKQTGDRSGRSPSGSLAPLKGAPKVDGATGPDPRIVAAAEQYARANGIDLKRQAEFVEINPELAGRIAQAYDQMQHNPRDPQVAAAYADMIQQTIAQHQALVDAGYQFFFYDESNDPYQGNPWNSIRDLRQNQRMGVFATEAGFGSGVTDLNTDDSPMLADTGIQWPYGSLNGPKKRVLANDLFRAVHDAFGHSMEGAGFRARGEENAWQAHVRLYHGPAVGAVTSETRGQNSWLNFGPYGEANQTASVEDTVFADQKIGLMPEFTWQEGRSPDEKSEEMAALSAQTETAAFKRFFKESKVVDYDGEPLVVYHATLGNYEAFSRRAANPEADMGAGFYFTDSEEDAANNYSHIDGPDIRNRIDNIADRYLGDEDFLAEIDEANEGLTPHDEGWVNERDRAREAAMAELGMTHEGMTIPVFLSIQNPLVIGDAVKARQPEETVFDYDGGETYDPETDEFDYGEPKGKLAEFFDAFRTIADRFDIRPDVVDRVISDLAMQAAENDGSLPASDVVNYLKRADHLMGYYDDEGRLAQSEIVRATMEEMGFDGIFDRTVSSKWGQENRWGGMKGVYPDTTHYIAFKPNQIKSAIGNRGTFDPSDDRIAFAKQSDMALRKQIGAFIRMGRSVNIPYTDAVHEVLAPHLNEVPDDAMVAVLSKVSPVKGDKKRVIATFKDHLGGTFQMLFTWEKLQSRRAWFGRDSDGNPTLYFVRFNPVGPGDSLLVGEMRHEVIHALRHGSNLPAALWGRLLSHAKNLRVLESDFKTYLERIGSPYAREARGGVSILEYYQDDYKKYDTYAESIDQEYVAHMAELYSHGELLPQEVAPVKDILDAINAGEYSSSSSRDEGVGEAAAFAGPWAKTASQNKLIQAQKLADIGTDPLTIWRRTGWYKAPDGRWKFEIDDSGAKFFDAPINYALPRTTSMKIALGKLLDHPKLYKAYPELANVLVILKPDMPPGDAGHVANNTKEVLGDDYIASLPANFFLLSTNPKWPTREAWATKADMRSALLHEIQHWIQDKEGFAGGSNPMWQAHLFEQRHRAGKLTPEDEEVMRSPEAIEAAEPMIKMAEGLKNVRRPTADQLIEAKAATRLYMDTVGFLLYQKIAGEIEAREVQYRSEMSEEGRREAWPQPVPADQQIVPDEARPYPDVSLNVAQTQTPQFKRWFGDSKIVDKQGNPLVVYHGALKTGFDRFDRGMENRNSGTGANGFYFTNHKLGAETYSGTLEEAIVSRDPDFDLRYDGEPGNYAVYLSMQNPLVVDFEGGGWDDAPEGSGFGGQTINDIASDAEAMGYDGVIAKNISDEGGYGQGYGWGDTTYIVFKPTQIKSATQNRGTFDPNDDSILAALAGPRAIGAPREAMRQAERMEGRGRSPQDIWSETGTMRGKEGKQRWEIDDSGAKIIGLDKVFTKGSPSLIQRLLGAGKPTGDVKTALNVPLLNVLKHDKLYNAYPFLRQMRVDLVYGPNVTTSGALRTRRGESGGTVYKPILARASNPESLKSVLLHEIQHYIQRREGFAEGSDMAKPEYMYTRKDAGDTGGRGALYDPGRDEGSYGRWFSQTGRIIEPTHPESIALRIMEDFEKLGEAKQRLAAGETEMMVRGRMQSIEEEAERLERMIVSDSKLLEDTMLVRPGDYQNSAGEIEARAVQERMNMTPEERRQTMPMAGMWRKDMLNTSAQTRDYDQAYAEVMRRAETWKRIKEGWAQAKPIGAGVAVVRPDEHLLVYGEGPEKPLARMELEAAFGEAIPLLNRRFLDKPYAEQKKIMDAIYKDVRDRNYMVVARRGVEDNGGLGIDENADPVFDFWARYDPRALAFDARLYRAEVEELARAQHGPDAEVHFSDRAGTRGAEVTSPDIRLAALKAGVDARKLRERFEKFLESMYKKYGSDYRNKLSPEEDQRHRDFIYEEDRLGEESTQYSIPLDTTTIFEGRDPYDVPRGVDRALYREMIADEQLARWNKLPRPGDDIDFNDLIPRQ